MIRKQIKLFLIHKCKEKRYHKAHVWSNEIGTPMMLCEGKGVRSRKPLR